MHVLLNWMWQGVAVALVAAAVLQIVPRSRTRARYAIAWTAYLAIVTLPAVPLLLAAFASAPGAGGGPLPAGTLPAAAIPAAPVAIPSVWWATGTAALVIWSLWAVISSCRTAAAAFAVGRARRTARRMPPDVEARLGHWRRLQGTGRRARLALSDDVATAGVLGGRVPIIAVAPVLLERLDLRDLDRVIAHEWAHVQRRDDVAQICVRVVSAVAGWHPAIWWLGQQLHVEREVACDEIAIAATGCARTYATCLTTLASIAAGRRVVPSLAAVSSSGLRERVVRIVSVQSVSSSRTPRLAAFGGATAVTVATLLVGQVSIVGAMAPAVARGVVGEDRVLTEAAPPPVTVVLGAAAPVRRATGIRRAPPVPAQPEQQHNRESDMVVADTAPAPLPAGAVVAAAAFELPAAIAGPPLVPPTARASDVALEIARAPQQPAWGKAMDAGRAIGARSEQAAAAAAGFFTRVGKRAARSF